MKTKAVFLDVDGTLISFNTHRVPDSAIQALNEVHNAGVKIIIATGRIQTDLKELEAIPYDGIVALNGAKCLLRDGTVISEHPILIDDFHTVKHLASKYDFPLAVEVEKGILVDKVTQTVIDLSNLTNHSIPPVVDLEKEFIESRCCQVCIYCGEDVEKEIMAQLPNLCVSRWNPYFADVNVAGINKATGLAEFAKHYGFDVSETAAIGDGGNDIPMLRVAGIGIAMGNAKDEVKAVADYVTTTVDEHGIRQALMWLYK